MGHDQMKNAKHDDEQLAAHKLRMALGAVIRKPETCRLVGLSYSTIRRLYLNDDFPRPIRLSPRATGFLRAEVMDWLDKRAKTPRTTAEGGAA